jgi:hypothetical protein
VEVGEVEDDAVGEVVEGEVVVEEALAGVDHADVVKLLLGHGLEGGDLHVDALEVELGSLVGRHAGELMAVSDGGQVRRDGIVTYIWRGDLDVAGVFLEDGLVVDKGLDEEGLDIMLGELLSQRTTAAGGLVDGIVDGDLAVLVIQPGVDVLATLLENLLAEDDGGGGCVGEEVVLGDDTARADCGAAVVAEMEDAGLDTEPGESVSFMLQSGDRGKVVPAQVACE